ncbi:hypothetical protein CHUAL_003942 [Chamberlinius hualienensis]
MLESASQYVTDFQSQFLKSFYPLSVLSRLFGYFPFVSLGNDLATTSEKRKFKWEIILTLISLIAMTYNNIWYCGHFFKFFVNIVRDTMHSSYFISYRVISVLLLLNFAFYKSKIIVTFCREISLLEVSLGNWTPKKQKNLHCFGLLLTMFILCNIGLYVAISHANYVNYAGYNNDVDYVLLLPGIAGIMFAYNFVSLIVIFFGYYFACQFQNLSRFIEKTFNSKHIDVTNRLSDVLCDIRKRHEQLVTCVDKFNSIMFPELLAYIIAESIAICVNFYELCMFELRPNDFVHPIASVVYVLVRLMPFLLISNTSNNLSNIAELCEKRLDESLFVSNSSECDFQKWLAKMRECVTDSQFLKSFYPLSVLSRVFGYFPFVSLGKDLATTSEKRKLNHFSMLLSNIVRDTIHSSYYVSYCAISALLLLNFAFYKSKIIVTFCREVSLLEASLGNWNAKQKKNLHDFGLLLTVFIISNIGLYVVISHGDYVTYSAYKNIFDCISLLPGIACVMFAYNFITLVVIFFGYYFRCLFLNLSRFIKNKLESKDVNVKNRLSDSLRNIRKRHEKLVICVDKFNNMMFPELLIYIIAESIAMCVNFYELCMIELRPNGFLLPMASVIYIFVRFMPFLIICSASNNLAKVAELCERRLDESSLVSNSRECDFQAILLFDQLERRKVQINMIGVVTVNNYLLFKVFCTAFIYDAK